MTYLSMNFNKIGSTSLPISKSNEENMHKNK
jgi:hypothetical protein